MGFKMRSGMKPTFKMMGSQPLKQYAEKNVSVDKVSDDGRTFTGTDSKGNTGEYLTNAYDAEVMQSDSVGVTGNAVSNMQMEYDMVKGTKYEQDFIDYHGKGDQPGTGKTTPNKQLVDPRGNKNDDKEDDKEDTRTTTRVEGRKSKDYTIVSDDGKTTTRNVTRRGGTKTVKLEDTDGEPTVKTNKRGKKTTTPPKVKMTKTKRSGKVVEKEISKGRAERMRRRGRRKGQEYDETGSPIKARAAKKAAKAAVKGAQAADRGKTRKANRQAVKAAGAAADAVSDGGPILQRTIEPYLERRDYEGTKLEPIATFSAPSIREVPTYHVEPMKPQTRYQPPITPVDHLPSIREVPTMDIQRKMPKMPKMPELTPLPQTSHGPIKEFHPPMNPNEGPYIVRARQEMAKRQADKNYDGPNYRHIRLNEKTGLDDGPHPERPLKKRGLWDNIHAKRKRGEKMRKKGDKGAPTEKAMRDSQ